MTNKTYSSRGYLVIEYVKIRDSSIKGKQFQNFAEYETNLISIVTRGYNIVFGNAFSGDFKYYQFKNQEGEREMTEPLVLEKGKVYGISNGSLNKWEKVKRGK